MFRYFIFVLLFCLLACKPVSLDAQGADRGKAKVEDFNTESNIRVALVDSRKVKPEEAPPELTYGSMDARFITLDGITYMVHWNDIEDHKNIKRGEEINFRASEYIARVEKTGRNYKVIFLNEL